MALHLWSQFLKDIYYYLDHLSQYDFVCLTLYSQELLSSNFAFPPDRFSLTLGQPEAWQPIDFFFPPQNRFFLVFVEVRFPLYVCCVRSTPLSRMKSLWVDGSCSKMIPLFLLWRYSTLDIPAHLKRDLQPGDEVPLDRIIDAPDRTLDPYLQFILSKDDKRQTRKLLSPFPPLPALLASDFFFVRSLTWSLPGFDGRTPRFVLLGLKPLSKNGFFGYFKKIPRSIRLGGPAV